jgi:hypothetical protein
MLPPPRRQRRFPGGRVPAVACVVPDLRAAVERAARQFNCSRSFVIAVALAETFGIETESYIIETRARRAGGHMRRVK